MYSIKSVSEGGREADNNHGEGELICKIMLMKAMLKTESTGRRNCGYWADE